MTIKAAIYCRTSTKDQISIPSQVHELKGLAASMGLDIVLEYIDGGRTGSNMRRADLMAMIESGAEGLFKVLLVYHNDRLSRNVEDVRRIMRELNAVGVQVKFKNIDQDLGTPEGLFTLNVMAAASELFLGDLKRKTRDGMAERKRAGTWTGRINGFFELKDIARGNVWHNIRPRPDRLPEIVEMDRLRADGHSYRFIGNAFKIDHKKVKRIIILYLWLKGQYAARSLELWEVAI